MAIKPIHKNKTVQDVERLYDIKIHKYKKTIDPIKGFKNALVLCWCNLNKEFFTHRLFKDKTYGYQFVSHNEVNFINPQEHFEQTKEIK